ncbi:transposase, partial [Heliophilum fasciatum]
ICPNGKRITSFNDVEDGRNFNITAKTYGCKHCPHYTTCFKGKKKRTVFVHHAFDTLLEAARHAQTDTYREQMRLRGRIEAKQNELLHHYGLRRVRYWGQRKLAFAARMKALGANLNKLNRRCWDKKNPLELDMHTARSITFKKVA